MNRLELVNHVKDLTGRTDKTTLIQTSLNLALEKIEQRRRFSWMRQEDSKTLLTGGNSVTLDHPVMRLNGARVFNSAGVCTSVLRIDQKKMVDIFIGDSVQSGLPVLCYLDGEKLIVAPATSQDVTIKILYWRSLRRFTNDEVENPVPGGDSCVASYAAFYTLKSILAIEDAKIHLAQFETDLNDLIRLDNDTGGRTRVLGERIAEPRSLDPLTDPFAINSRGDRYQ